MRGMITDILRASGVDGPGIRTVVFLKGCPLHCQWCHNPECIRKEQEILWYPERCIHCGRCKEGCYSKARELCGRWMQPEEVMEQILADRPYYGEKGGVTISGGEPLLQPVFLEELLMLCKKEGIHTAVETSLFLYEEDIFRQTDLVMADLKIWDEEMHRIYTGASNRPVLEHFERLDGLQIPVIARTPVIPGVNDAAENIVASAAFLRKRKRVIRYELLPYHPMGVGKAQALGREAIRFSVPSKQKMEELKQYADLAG